MSFVIEKDNGKGNKPTFLHTYTDIGQIWADLDKAQLFDTEDKAQAIIDDNDLRDCITMPFNEVLT